MGLSVEQLASAVAKNSKNKTGPERWNKGTNVGLDLESTPGVLQSPKQNPILKTTVTSPAPAWVDSNLSIHGLATT